jgi:hypothetical protein
VLSPATPINLFLGNTNKGKRRIDNLNNAISPNSIEYPIFKAMGEQWLDFFYPKWREMGNPGQRGQYLRPLK